MRPMYVALHEVTRHVAWLYSVYTEHAQMAVVSHCTSHVQPNTASVDIQNALVSCGSLANGTDHISQLSTMLQCKNLFLVFSQS